MHRLRPRSLRVLVLAIVGIVAAQTGTASAANNLSACFTLGGRAIPVSLAYPSVAISYIIVGVIAHYMWNEPFGLPQIGGMLMIGGGILLLHQ